ncbi:hypothetical protein PPW95_25410 (plasmid) [Vibrio parahaemolyticus]|uniref:hypothetical protein n=1 Tax=Vibrio harveyi group TaxID=717610 RepID=UPI000971B47A|nr:MULTISPECIES: hypothetical protein [Vibrio harveyi group]APX10076.1 hypothetical protein BWP24_28210 [Vibrio campbellii]WCP78843.1 hypothetical protein PPW95_25410 [Vibrio parahaemolyticus]
MKISLNALTSKIKDLTKDRANEIAFKGWIVKDFYWTRTDIQHIFSCEWMCGLSNDGFKRRTSIYRMDTIFLDIDDPTKHGDNLLNHVHSELTKKNVSHAIATSTHHLKEKVRKSGEILPACPRMKMMIPLTEPIFFNSEEDKDDWNYSRPYIINYLKKLLDVEELDASSFDVNRASFRMNSSADNHEFVFFKGEPLMLKNLIKKMPPPEPRKPIETNSDNERNLINAASWFFGENRPRDEWVKVAAAVYHEFGAETLQSLTKLSKGELLSFKRQSGNSAGAGTIIFFAQQYGWSFPVNEKQEKQPKPENNQANSMTNYNSMWID